MAIKEMIVKVVEGRSLRETEAAAAMLDIVEGLATPSQISAFVIGLRMKGETAEEIAGLARIMRNYATRVEAGPDAVDIVGTGGDGGMTFNISTISAIVMGVHHRDEPVFGVQFHPESILTDGGKILLQNFLDVVHQTQAQATGQPVPVAASAPAGR